MSPTKSEMLAREAVAINELPLPQSYPGRADDTKQLPPGYTSVKPSAALITTSNTKVWCTQQGRELVTLGKGSNVAKVVISIVSREELEALATACWQAALEMEQS